MDQVQGCPSAHQNPTKKGAPPSLSASRAPASENTQPHSHSHPRSRLWAYFWIGICVSNARGQPFGLACDVVASGSIATRATDSSPLCSAFGQSRQNSPNRGRGRGRPGCGCGRSTCQAWNQARRVSPSAPVRQHWQEERRQCQKKQAIQRRSALRPVGKGAHPFNLGIAISAVTLPSTRCSAQAPACY